MVGELPAEEELWDRMDHAKTPLLLLAAIILPYGLLCGSEPSLWLWGPSSRSLISAGALSSRHLDQGELWRLPRSLFLHADLLHLVFNGAALWVLSRTPQMDPELYEILLERAEANDLPVDELIETEQPL